MRLDGAEPHPVEALALSGAPDLAGPTAPRPKTVAIKIQKITARRCNGPADSAILPGSMKIIHRFVRFAFTRKLLRAAQLLALVSVAAASVSAGTRPVIMGTRGVVVSGHHQASAAGLDMLRKGGNAADAGVATVFAQAVVEFDRFGIGGEVPILIYLAKEEKVVSINGHGFAPLAATLEWFKERNIDVIPGDGFLPAVVPSVIDTLILTLDRYGTLSLADVLAPAIELAEKGFPMFGEFKAHIEEQEARFRQQWPSSGKVFLPGGQVPEIGDVFVPKRLGPYAPKAGCRRTSTQRRRA